MDSKLKSKRSCRWTTFGVAPESRRSAVCVCLKASSPHRGIPNASRIVQS